MRFFGLNTIKGAVERLRLCRRKDLLVPFVLAANGVDAAQEVNVQSRLGTDSYLNKFFNGAQLGLESRIQGKPCTVTPRFSDLTDDHGSIACQVDSKLWANIFSVQGYPQMRNGVVLAQTSGSNFQLGTDFSTWFRNEIPAEFKFEDLLTWCYAFSGFPETVNSWQDLLAHFLQEHVHGGLIPAPYQPVFSLDPSWVWPLIDVSPARPSNRELQEAFFPGASACEIAPEQFVSLFEALDRQLQGSYLGFFREELRSLAASIVSDLQSCRRLFLLGDPGTGKTQLASLINAAFLEVFGLRVHSIAVPVTDGTTADKFLGFSTLDGRWIDGMLTQASSETGRKLLYPVPTGGAPLKQREREQINVLVLDEANRRDAEDLLAKIQSALDSEHQLPEHVSNEVKLDNSGTAYLSPNTFLVMTGNSPRDDAGRVVQSRPFKRRHNLVTVPNVFETALELDLVGFTGQMVALWQHHGTRFSIAPAVERSFLHGLDSDAQTTKALQVTLQAMRGFSIGLSYGLAKKFLKTAAARFALDSNFPIAVDQALTESVLPLLSSEAIVDGMGVRESLAAVDPICRARLPNFYDTVHRVIAEPDSFGRPRHFL